MGKVLGKFRLQPHPDLPHPVLSVACKVSRIADSVLIFEFVAIGEISGLAVPDLMLPQRCDGLWNATCFEAFLGAEDGSYIELNFSPSRCWASYRFEGYRDGMAPGLDMAQPDIYVESSSRRLGLTAHFEIPADQAPNRLALSAVIEEIDGTKSYWALAHPPGKPDFHHPTCFAATLPAPNAA